MAADAPNAAAYRGLETLMSYLKARRIVLHERFVRRWDELERHDFAGKLEWDIERATNKAMVEVSLREQREEAEREEARALAEAERAAAELERAAAELERRSAEESQRLTEELEQRENGDDGNVTATSGDTEATTMDGVVTDQIASGNGAGDPPNDVLRS